MIGRFSRQRTCRTILYKILTQCRPGSERSILGVQQRQSSSLRDGLWNSTTVRLDGRPSSLHHNYKNRCWSSTAFPKGTAIALNPRKDDDGKDMLVEITSRASDRLREIMKKDANPDLILRVAVESGGCHGFQYLMSLTNSNAISDVDDTIFTSTDGSDAKVVMDEPSLELLKGSKIDYTMELIGSQFKVVGNPAASSSCGCGTSFDIKP